MSVREVKLPNIYRWIISIPLGIALFLVFFLNWKETLLLLLDLETQILLCVLLILLFTNTLTHEYAHKAFATLFNYKSKVFLKLKRCIVYGKITPIHFLITVLAPQLLYTILIILLLGIFPQLFVIISLYIVIAIDSSKSDIYMAGCVIPYCFKNRDYYLEYKEGGSYVLFNQSTH